MGNQCCHVQNLTNHQFINTINLKSHITELDDKQKETQQVFVDPITISKQNRKGYPNQKNYLSISNPQLKKILQKELQISPQQLILEYKKNQRKFKKSLPNLQRIKHNELSQPYLILKQNYNIYVGEWVYKEQFNQDVPEGIGRLYQNDYISQGIILTFQDFENCQQLTKSQNTEGRSVKRITTIHQYGRRYNQLLYYQGQFFKGKYQGEGKLEIGQKKHKEILAQYKAQLLQRRRGQNVIEQQQSVLKKKVELQKQFQMKSPLRGEHRKEKQKSRKQKKKQFVPIEILAHYYYQGEWFNNLRDGVGVQKVKNLIFVDQYSNYKLDGFQYSGDYIKDKRTGRGKYIPLLNNQKKIKLQQDIIKVSNEFKERQNQINEQFEFQLKEHQKISELWNNFLQEMKYDWQPQFRKKLNLRANIFKNDAFLKSRYKRTCFEEYYQGEFKDDNFHGQGTYIWHNGKIYDGQWEQGQMHGIGQFVWPNGAKYQGQYKNDKRHGYGIMTWNPFKIWRGSWAFGLRHGYGETIELKKIDNLNFQLTIKGELWNRNLPKQTFFFKQYNLINKKELIYTIPNQTIARLEDQIQQLAYHEKSSVASVSQYKKFGQSQSEKQSQKQEKQDNNQHDQFLGIEIKKNNHAQLKTLTSA